MKKSSKVQKLFKKNWFSTKKLSCNDLNYPDFVLGFTESIIKEKKTERICKRPKPHVPEINPKHPYKYPRVIVWSCRVCRSIVSLVT